MMTNKIIIAEFAKFLKENHVFIQYRMNIGRNVVQKKPLGWCSAFKDKIILHYAKREGNEEELNKILNMMNVYDFNNIQDIIDFSFIEQMELINWRDSKLYHMQQALEMMKEQENNG